MFGKIREVILGQAKIELSIKHPSQGCRESPAGGPDPSLYSEALILI